MPIKSPRQTLQVIERMQSLRRQCAELIDSAPDDNIECTLEELHEKLDSAIAKYELGTWPIASDRLMKKLDWTEAKLTGIKTRLERME